MGNGVTQSTFPPGSAVGAGSSVRGAIVGESSGTAGQFLGYGPAIASCYGRVHGMKEASVSYLI